ncbi:MAG: tRNA1(Val) (adenine(37)-N6)-methyltransferase [bacterium]|nr:tRNA1(Val) (adenine(37)-N6)-methyltransferase [bacterium]
MERLEPIGNKMSIFVNDEHIFGTDAILLADFAACSKVNKACDLGTGCGIIPMVWLRDNRVNFAYGVEIQQQAANLAEKTARLNGIQDRFTVLNRDLKELKGAVEFGSFDLVCCNPPYKASGAGILNASSSACIARHETLCTFEDITATAAKLLKYSGRFCVCHRPERLTDVFCTMRQYKIEPKRLRNVIQRQGQKPWLVLVEGRLGGKPGLDIQTPLYIEENQEPSAEMQSICKEYRSKSGISK